MKGTPSFSNVLIKSNLLPVNGRYVWQDLGFLKSIRDPRALEQVKKKVIDQKLNPSYHFTSIQDDIFSKVCVPCANADKGDFPFGMVINDKGQEELVCLCQKSECSYYEQCCPEKIRKRKDLQRGFFNQFNLEPERIESNFGLDFEFLDEATVTSETVEVVEPIISHTQSDKQSDKSIEMSNESDVVANIIDEQNNDYDEPETVSPLGDKIDDEQLEHDVAISCESLTEDIPEPVVSMSEEVSDSQEAYIALPIEARIVVDAGPGTGKTWALIERLIHLLREGADSDSIVVLCYTRAAVGVVENRLRVAAEKYNMGTDWSNVEVRTFDSFATRMLSQVLEEHPECLPKNYQLTGQGFDRRIEQFTKLLQEHPDVMESCACMFVDETQDLVGVRAEMVLAMLQSLDEDCGFSLLGDSCQSLYDYEARQQSSEWDSSKFRWIVQQAFPDVYRFTFLENHRQIEKMRTVIEPLRAALQTDVIAADDDCQMVRNVCKQISDEIGTVNFEQMLSLIEQLHQAKPNAPVAILTRTNMEALRLSSLLSDNDVRHELQLAQGNERNLASWISNVFMSFDGDTINRDEFIEAFLSNCSPKEQIADSCWQALLESLGISGLNGRYEIAELLEGIIKRPYSRWLFEDAMHSYNNVVVSNIHRVKGKEFDTVFLPADLLKLYQKNNTLDEGRVNYVALTRAKHYVTQYKFPLRKTTYVSLDPKTGEGRLCNRHYTYHRRDNHSGSGSGEKLLSGRSRLAEIEFGLPGDISMTALATEEIQDILSEDIVQPGFSLLLKKNRKGKLQYRLIDADGEIDFGFLPGQFLAGYTQKYLLSITEKKEMQPSDYPDEFSGINIQSLISCLEISGAELPGARRFGDVNLWRGISVAGIASPDFGDRH